MAPALGLRGDDAELQWLTTRRDEAGTSVRFAQLLDGVPVREGQVVVRLTLDGDIDWVASGAVPGLRLHSATPAIAREDAVRIARQRVAGADLRVEPEATLVAAPRAGGRGVLAWDVTIATAAPLHDWHVLLSAADGDVLELADGLRNEVGSGKV